MRYHHDKVIQGWFYGLILESVQSKWWYTHIRFRKNGQRIETMPRKVSRVNGRPLIFEKMVHIISFVWFLSLQNSEEPWCSEIQYSLGRLLQGLASERKASRLGYSLALSHLMSQLDLNDDSRIGKILSLADEKLNQPKEKKAIIFMLLITAIGLRLGMRKIEFRTRHILGSDSKLGIRNGILEFF